MSSFYKDKITADTVTVVLCVAFSGLSWFTLNMEQNRSIELREQLAKSMENTEKAVSLIEKSAEVASRSLNAKVVAEAGLLSCEQKSNNLEMLLKYLKDKK